MHDIDDMMSDQEENETRGSSRSITQKQSLDDILGGTEKEEITIAEKSENEDKVPVGKVERFFSKINVAAINLTGSIKVGDMLEITNEEETMILKVSSMQINKADVEEASEGDSVGIKTNGPVSPGSDVYLIG